MPSPDTAVQLLIIGLTNGSVIALSAMAVTLIYGVIRTLNLAHGDVFALTTVVAASVVAALGITQSSPLLVLLGGLAVTVVVSMLFGAGLNAAIDRFAFQPFRGRSRLAPLIATLGLSFVLYQVALIWRYLLPTWIPGEHRSVPGVPELFRIPVPEVLPTNNLLMGNVLSNATLTPKDVLVIALAVACAFGVRAFMQNTRTGKAIRAVAQNAELASILGVNTGAVIRQTFLLGGALVGVAAFTFAVYYTQSFNNAGAQSGLIAFAAAILGGIGNPLGALLAGLLLGVCAAFSDYILAAQWTPVLLQSLLIGLLLIRPSGITGGDNDSAPEAASERDAIAVTTTGQRGVPLFLWILFALGLLYPVLDQWLGLYRQSLATNMLIFALLALGLNVLLGYAGLLDLGYAVSFGIGGYVAALVSNPYASALGAWLPQPLDFTVVMIFSACGAALFGALNGPLTRRLRSDYLAIVTLALGTIARQTIVNLSNAVGDGGSISAIPAPTLLTHTLRLPIERYYLAFVLVVLLVIASRRLAQSRAGRAWLASSEDAVAAASNGVDVPRYRLLAFIVSSAIAGVAGALYATTFTYIDPEAVDFRLSVMALAMVILGGAGSVPGALAAAVIIVGYDQLAIPLLGEWLAQFQTTDLRFGSALDPRSLSYLNFGMALYLTVLFRARQRPPSPPLPPSRKDGATGEG
ncbi:MAG: ABC transporter permease [Anaerolineales bacterium]